MDRNKIKKLIEKQYPISYNEYLNVCLAFARDSENWLVVDDRKHYTTDIYGISPQLWQETPDNAHGGLDVSWAFHQNPDDIKIRAKDHYKDIYEMLIDTAIADGWYDDIQFISPCVDLGDDDAALIDFIGAQRYGAITKYPSAPNGSSFYVNIDDIKRDNPDKDWNNFDWDLYGSIVMIYENDHGYWECIAA